MVNNSSFSGCCFPQVYDKSYAFVGRLAISHTKTNYCIWNNAGIKLSVRILNFNYNSNTYDAIFSYSWGLSYNV